MKKLLLILLLSANLFSSSKLVGGFRKEAELDTNNSSTTPLIADATFTGEATDTTGFSALSILVEADEASATDGLTVQFSFDGTNWHDGESYTIPADSNKWFTPPIQGKYYRVVYVNGSTGQSDFHLHSMLKTYPIKWSSHNLNDDLLDDDDAELVASVLKLRTAQDTYVSGSATNSGNFKVSLEEAEPPLKDTVTGALNVVEYAHHEIHSGSNYRVQCNNDAIPATGSGGELVIGFYVPDQAKLPHMVWDFVHEGDMTIKLLEDVTLTLSTGTDFLCKNSRRDAGDTSILQGVETGSLVSGYVTCDPSYSGGTVISLKRNYGARNIGSEGSRRAEVILKTDTYYAFVMDNNETSAQGGQLRLEWYEHADAS